MVQWEEAWYYRVTFSVLTHTCDYDEMKDEIGENLISTAKIAGWMGEAKRANQIVYSSARN